MHATQSVAVSILSLTLSAVDNSRFHSRSLTSLGREGTAAVFEVQSSKLKGGNSIERRVLSTRRELNDSGNRLTIIFPTIIRIELTRDSVTSHIRGSLLADTLGCCFQ